MVPMMYSMFTTQVIYCSLALCFFGQIQEKISFYIFWIIEPCINFKGIWSLIKWFLKQACTTCFLEQFIWGFNIFLFVTIMKLLSLARKIAVHCIYLEVTLKNILFFIFTSCVWIFTSESLTSVKVFPRLPHQHLQAFLQ